MSRLDEAREFGDPVPKGLAERWADLAVNGKPGQAVLRELREALLALPEHSLIIEKIIDTDAAEPTRAEECVVCALGALMLYRLQQGRLVSRGEPIETVEHLVLRFADLEGIYATQDAAEGIGITQTLAWMIADQNDEGIHDRATGEARWRSVFDWVERQIAA